MTRRSPGLTIIRRLRASPARVWAAITEPDQMLQWWGPDAGPTLSVEADVRPGGRYSVIFRLITGEEHNPTGYYREVMPERRLVFTWELPGTKHPNTLVTFQLDPCEEGTRLTLTHEGLPDEEARESHERGWNGLLEKLPIFLGEIHCAS